MKTNLHPQYHSDITIKCACGATVQTGSTEPSIQVEICSACHPFFTGEMRFVDTMGRVEKFRAKVASATGKTKKSKKKDVKKVQTFREVLESAK